MAEIKIEHTIIAMLILGIADATNCEIDNTSMRCTVTFPRVIPFPVVSVFVSQLRKDPSPKNFRHDSWKQVTSLDISLHADANDIRIRNSTFVNLNSLRQFGLHGQSYFSLESYAFSGLDLYHLDLSGCSALSDKEVTQALLPENILPSLRSLNLDDIQTRDFETFTMGVDFSLMLHHKDNLTNLSLRGANLIFDGSNVNLTYASNSLKHVDISSTSFVISSNAPLFFFRDYVFPSLESLNISYFELLNNFIFYFKDESYTFCKPGYENEIEAYIILRQLYANGLLHNTLDAINSSFDVSNCTILLNSVQFQKNKLRNLDVRVLWPKENHVLKIDLSFNEIEFISPDFIKGLTKIEILDLGNNKLFKMEMSEKLYDVFEGLTKLKDLRLNRNQLKILPYRMFQHNERLRVLDLSGNKFETILFKIDHLTALEKLDLRHNQIKTIGGSGLEGIKRLLHHASLRDIFLSNNIFECTCENYALIDWLQKEHTDEKLQCYIDGNVNAIGETVLTKTKFLCYKTIVILCCSLFVYVVIVLVCIALYKRHRNKAIAGTQTFLNEFKAKQLDDIEWLGMVSYCSEDGDIVVQHIYQTLQDCLKTMIDVPFSVICNNEIDFRPGVIVAAEIVRCISKSCVLIVAVSESYCKKTWCSREVEEAYKQGKPIILVFLEHVDEGIMPPFLKKIFQRYTRVKLEMINGEYKLHPTVESVSKSIIRLAEQRYMSESICKIC